MNNQLAEIKEQSSRKVVLLLVAIAIATLLTVTGVYAQHLSDPYVQSVLSLQGDVQQGHSIYQINCAGCHGYEALGNVGPDLHDVHKRKSRTALIRQVTTGNTPPMPKFQASPQEMADLLSFLETL